jgi:hypothetical protein
MFVTPAVTAIIEALAATKAEGKLAVVGHVRLAVALGAARDVIPVALPQRVANELPDAIEDLSTIAPASLAAVIGANLTTTNRWQATLASWSRVVRDGGAIVFVDRGRAHEGSRRALCAGLSEIEQRHAGRMVITSGLVSHF